MDRLSIFVASSSEAETIAKAITARLEAELGDAATIDLWRSKFDLSDTPIESLEDVAKNADFAILVMSADDLTLSRHTETVAPRDNLVFELGLFIGALGRERSFIVRDEVVSLKLPSDILGVLPITYTAEPPRAMTSSIRSACKRLAAQIVKRGPRPKWLALGEAAAEAADDFRGEIEGSWWERIDYPQGSKLSLFTVTADPLTGGLTLKGTSYGQDGNRSALWKSEMVRLYPQERRILYLWTGNHPLPKFANLRFHGHGVLEFDPPDGSSSVCVSGTGEFWDVDEARPRETVLKPVELQRVLDDVKQRLASTGSAAGRARLLRSVMERW